MKEALAKQHLHGKLIEPEKVASVVTFLFTDGASAINRSTISGDRDRQHKSSSDVAHRCRRVGAFCPSAPTE